MRTVLSRLGPVLAVGSAVLTAACGGSSTLTTHSDDAPVAMKTSTQDSATVPVSATIRGTVVDPANRPLANMTIECLGDVHCTEPQYAVTAEDHRITHTDAKGAFEIVAASLPGTSSASFMMNANGLGYDEDWRQVAWPGPGCSSSDSRCTITINFKLNPTAH